MNIPSLAYNHVILIGMPACGKSFLGIKLAAKLKRPLYDNDILLEEKYSQSITNIFRDLGEAIFRSYESEILKHVISQPSGVISLGGGGVLAQQNRELIKDNNLVFYIRASVPTLLKNLDNSNERPLLAGSINQEERLSALLKQREAIYHECSSMIIDADNLSAGDIIKLIMHNIPDANA